MNMKQTQQVVQTATEMETYGPSQGEQVDAILQDLEMVHISVEDLKLLRNYIELKRRQARKAINQRKTLKQLHRAQQAIVMENRWLHEMVKRELGVPRFAYVMNQTKETLWSMFRGLRSGKKGS